MGGKHGAKCLHSIKNLGMKQVAEIGRGLAHDRGMITPTIDVDFSNLCFKKGSVGGSINFMSRFAAAGFRVVPVADGKRPVCKQATNEREANREKARIQAAILKTQLIQGNRELSDLRSRFSDEEYAKMKEELTKVESTMKAKETFSRKRPTNSNEPPQTKSTAPN